MGTMVLNHLFSTQRSALVDANAIDNIIYMGAACSVIDAIQTLDPLMESYGTNKPPQFYNLTLHPLAEMSEEMFPEKWPAGILPAGSLLHLIDTHLESPNTPLDRTLGSQVNVMSSIEAFNRIKANCHFKGFDFVPGVLPTRHGDFSKSPFWQEDFRSAKRFDQLPEHILKKMK